jgi:hypothetical protein
LLRAEIRGGVAAQAHLIATGPCLDSRFRLPNSLYKISIPRHIKMPAHIWSTKYR